MLMQSPHTARREVGEGEAEGEECTGGERKCKREGGRRGAESKRTRKTTESETDLSPPPTHTHQSKLFHLTIEVLKPAALEREQGAITNTSPTPSPVNAPILHPPPSSVSRQRIGCIVRTFVALPAAPKPSDVSRPPCQKFSKVSALVNLLYQIAGQLTVENPCLVAGSIAAPAQ